MRFRKKKAPTDPYEAHEIVEIDEWAPGQRRIRCSCGTSCLDKGSWRAEELYRIHVETQTS